MVLAALRITISAPEKSAGVAGGEFSSAPAIRDPAHDDDSRAGH